MATTKLADGTVVNTSVVNGRTVGPDGNVIPRSNIIVTTDDSGRMWAGDAKVTTTYTAPENGEKDYDRTLRAITNYAAAGDTDAYNNALAYATAQGYKIPITSTVQTAATPTQLTPTANADITAAIRDALAAIAKGQKKPKYVSLPTVASWETYLPQATELTKEATKAANLEVLAQFAEAKKLVPYGLNTRGLNHGGVLRGAYTGIDQKLATALDMANATALAKNIALANDMRNQDYQQEAANAQALNAWNMGMYGDAGTRANTVLSGLLNLYGTNAGITQSGLELYGNGIVGNYDINALISELLNKTAAGVN